MNGLREMRLARNMTGSDVAKLCGITNQAYYYIENGKRRPTVDTAKRIGAALGFNWTRFYEDTPPGGAAEGSV